MTGRAVARSAARACRVAAVPAAIAAVALAAPPVTATAAAPAATVGIASDATLAAPPVTAAAAAADCTGVTVVVDFTRLGGEVEQGCAPPEADTGLEALRGAGFSYTFVPQIPGMVCQIDGLPDPCNGAPAHAYWAYWVGDVEGGWRYSTEGAGTRALSPGDRQGWAFGDGQQPGSPTRQRAGGGTSTDGTSTDDDGGDGGDDGDGGGDGGDGGDGDDTSALAEETGAGDHTATQEAPVTPVGVVTAAALVLGAALLWRRRP